jgi:hypothetical protein
MPSETINIRKLRNGSIAVFDKDSKTLFVIPKALVAKFKRAGSSLNAAESLASDPKVVKLTKPVLSSISEAMAALIMLT